MMKEEFEKLTGLKVSWDEYKAIEQAYMDFDGDKYDFCKAYKGDRYSLRTNIDKIAQRDAEIKNILEAKNAEIKMLKDQIAALNIELAKAEEKLEKAEEWRDYEDEHNVKQQEYENLRNDRFTRELNDDEAVKLVAEEWGFDPGKIRIVHEVAKQQISRHNRCRNVGIYERKPLYNATDWNYIRFNVIGNVAYGYEMYKGELQMFWG